MTPTPPPTDDKLLPCPFCGETAGVLFTPTCDRKTPYNPADRAFPIVRCASCFAEAHGTDWDQRGKTAIAAWNTRAALRPEPSPIRTKLPSPCDDEALERELVEAVKIARTSDAKYVSDILDATSVLNIVLQITEGSDILDRLIERHLNDHFATLADATAQVIERDFPELKPQTSPDDAPVLDQHESAALQNDNINGCGPLALQMEAEYQRTRAAVLARMDRRAVIEACVAALKDKQKMLIDVGCDGPVVNAFSSAMGVIRSLADKETGNG